MTSYLIFRTDRIGDFLLTIILINSIKRNDPSSFITVVSLRKKIGYNERKKYIKYFNSEKVASFIINKTFGLKTNETFLWKK